MSEVKSTVTKKELSPEKAAEVTPIAFPDKPATIRRDIKAELLAMREKDKQPVRGLFKFYEAPGSVLSFSFRKYAQDDVQRYDLHDGQVHTIPLGVAKHLNKNGWYPTYSYSTDDHGRPTTKIGKKNRRFGFQSLEFMEMEDLQEEGSSGIVTAQYI